MSKLYAIPRRQELHTTDVLFATHPRMKQLMIGANGWVITGWNVFKTATKNSDEEWLDSVGYWLMRNNFSYTVELCTDGRFLFTLKHEDKQ